IAAVAFTGRPVAAAPRLEPVAHAGRVTVLAEPGLESLARRLAAGAEHELDEIALDQIDLPAPRAIEVHLVRDAADLAAVAPAGRGAPSWAVGVAYPDLGVIGVATRRGAQLVDPEATLSHELAHIALGAALGDRAPHWLHEGFAYQHAAEWSMDRIETLSAMAWGHSIISLDRLDATFPDGELPASRAYAEAYDFVRYLARRGRWEEPTARGDRWPFRRFLRDIGHGAGLDQAAIHAFGKPLHALFDEWQADLGSRYLLVPIGLLGAALWVLCAMLLALAWWRRRRHNQRRLAQWDLEDRLRSSDPHHVNVPPYVPWPGEDPLTTEPDDDEPYDPRSMN
ncbi:MAG TPA: peptidase MA family metallohydrolase, partial [Kofleriaceae bacterium]|nr:peptidase MA family metallohydrolase [Kofleriaceae bacterium]